MCVCVVSSRPLVFRSPFSLSCSYVGARSPSHFPSNNFPIRMTRAKPHDAAAVCQTCVTPFVPADASSSRTCCMCGAYTSPNMTRKHLVCCSTAPPSKSHFFIFATPLPDSPPSFKHRHAEDYCIGDWWSTKCFFVNCIPFDVSFQRDCATLCSPIKYVINWNLYFALTFWRSWM